MLAVGDPRWRLSEQRRQLLFALEQRQAGDVLAVEFEEVEGEIDEAVRAAVGSLLHQLERGDPVRTHAAKFSVDVGCLDF